MKKTILYIVLAMLWPVLNSQAQDIPAVPKTTITLSGKISNEKGEGLPGASVKVKRSSAGTVSDAEGHFRLTQVPLHAVITITFIGYLPQELATDGTGKVLSIMLQPASKQLEEVIVNTGYQEVPLERATGSYDYIDKDLFNRRVSTSVLDRLEGLSSGLIFNRNTLTPNEQLGISIRGRSTLDSRVNPDPLIVLDNFPYEGDISNINPNDVESITILKDAAAASIWGARAGNGVIVITTKKGRYATPLQIEVNSNVTVGAKPDLFYSADFINSADFIEAERFLYSKGFFDADINNTISSPSVSPVVELFEKQAVGLLTQADAEAQINALKGLDVRNDFTRYVYRQKVNRQHAVSLRGGGINTSFNLAVGYDQNQDNLVRNGYNRITVSSLNTFRPAKDLELTAGLNYVQSHINRNGNGSAFGSIISGGKYALLPYARLADQQGNPLPVEKDFREAYVKDARALGFHDWQYRPLEEIQLANNTSSVNDLHVRAGAKYNFTSYLNAGLQYVYERQLSDSRDYRSQQTYYTRNLLNQFSQRDPATGAFLYPFPEGGILYQGNNVLNLHNIRGQLNFNRNIGSKHALNAIAGAERRERLTEGYSRTSYGYDDELGTAVNNINYGVSYPRNPSGSATIPPPSGSVNGTTNRFISYYANAAYTYSNRYTFSISGRKDGANIFGVRTNERITPLWSAGLAWDINREPFYKIAFLPYLKLRATYGFSGNVYNTSAYLTAQYYSSSLTGNRYALITSPPNPELSWEKVRNANLGIDFGLTKNVVTGSIEAYIKDGLDLIQSIPLAPSSGYYSFKGNAASARTTGMDITLNTRNMDGAFKWQTAVLMSLQKDKVIRFDNEYSVRQLVGSSVSPGTSEAGGLFAVTGKPLFGVYSYRWAGFDPQTGDPQGYLNGQVSKDYLAIINNARPDSIVFHGSSRPGLFGAFRNTFSFKGFEVSANITYKLRYYFRKNTGSTNYQDVLNNNGLHSDFSQRWQKPGDEVFATLPSMIYPNDNNRSAFFKASEANIEKGDHIRFQDISISYNLNKNLWKSKMPVNTRIYLYANNLGLIWKANKAGLDPDYLTRFSYPEPRSLGFGFRTSF